MASVSALTIDELVDKALEGAPQINNNIKSEEFPKTANVYLSVADKLDKIASSLEISKKEDVVEFKSQQVEKKAALTQIVKTYLELESSK